MKVLMIGLDGATWNLIKPWASQGYLPTFRRLLDEGVHGDLESTIPPWTIPAWNAISTGKNPGKLGFALFASRQKGSYTFKPEFLYTKETDVWHILSDAGKTVIVVNPPNVHQATRVNGCMVSGFLYLNKEVLMHPKALKNKLDEAVGGYEVDVLDADIASDVEKRYEFARTVAKKEEDERYVERVHRVLEKRFKASRHLLKEKWDFAFLVFVATDRLQHRFWTNKSILLDLYKKIDSELQTLLSIIDKDTIVIMVSDHGFGPVKRRFNINEWALKEGYLELKKENNSNWNKTANALRGLKLLPLVRAAMKLVPSRISRSLNAKVNYVIVEGSNVNWENTILFTQPSEHVCGDLYLNVIGREPNGAVDPKDYERTRNEIIEKLRNLKDSTNGEKITAKVYRKEEIYEGENLDRAPDLMIQIDDNIGGFNARVGYNQTFMESKEGDHKQNGIFLAYGPQIKKETKIEGARIYDITPTILHIFDLPVDKDMAGRVLKEIFATESQLSKREVRCQAYAAKRSEGGEQTRSDETEEKIKDRLRKLGYI
jgi:predicted AlkP superfamily phosphohydrolase/phosphomutase